MIDNNKIKEASIKALKESVYNNYMYTCPYIEGFYACAKWVQEEFFKDLWHSADEMPNENNEVICVDKDSRTITYDGIANWWAFCRTHDVTQWLYIDNLLPKKGGEQ